MAPASAGVRWQGSGRGGTNSIRALCMDPVPPALGALALLLLLSPTPSGAFASDDRGGFYGLELDFVTLSSALPVLPLPSPPPAPTPPPPPR